jgi:DNA-binding NarL/FixJ family response regulator
VLRLALPSVGVPRCDHDPVSRSVLIVDDDASFRDLATRILSSWGHVVIGEAGNVTEAVERAGELRPDTLLVDIGLPDGDGFALTERLCAMPWPMRIVLVSADADRANAVAAGRVGACGFFPKDELSGPAVRRLIEHG